MNTKCPPPADNTKCASPAKGWQSLTQQALLHSEIKVVVSTLNLSPHLESSLNACSIYNLLGLDNAFEGEDSDWLFLPSHVSFLPTSL